MAMQFKKATKAQARLRLALIGPSGSGKTFSALSIAQHLGGQVALVDTERGSASKYASDFSFDVLELDTFHPERYIEAIQAAEAAGYDVLILDSLSHAWIGKEGALELVDRAAARQAAKRGREAGNSFAAWREVTPLHNALVEAMVQSRLHLIVTMRAKTEYVMETNEKGKSVPRKVGLAPVQRDGLEYEFDVVADLDLDHNLLVSKTRCRALDNAVIARPGKQVADMLKAWLSDGAAPEQMPDEAPAPQPKPNGHGRPARPWDAETLRQYMQERALALGTAAPDEKLLVKTRASLSNLTNGDDKRRRTITAYLFDAPSSANLTVGECETLVRWINARHQPDGEWVPDPTAVQEAAAVVRAYQVEQGQQEMALEGAV